MAVQEREVVVLMNTQEFSQKAPFSISADKTRQVLADVGLPPLPQSVASPSARGVLLDSAPKMKSEQVAEFLRRVGVR